VACERVKPTYLGLREATGGDCEKMIFMKHHQGDEIKDEKPERACGRCRRHKKHVEIFGVEI